MAPKCDLCGDQPYFLHARCHLTAPLAVRVEGHTLIASCYLPECGREVVRLKIAASADVARLVAAARAALEHFDEFHPGQPFAVRGIIEAALAPFPEDA